MNEKKKLKTYHLMNVFMALILINIPFNKSHASGNNGNSGNVDNIEFYPAPILLSDNYFSHHILIAEKSTHTLYLYKNHNNRPQFIKSYQMATGKKSGDKFFQGDHRTPEGIYHFTEFIPHDELVKRHGEQGQIYGVGAFVMNYPNSIDGRKGKTGSGIWLHSTNDETRIDKGLDSRGCIVSDNINLIDISQYLELHKTNIIVVDELLYLPQKSWMQKRQKIISFITDWKKAWEAKNLSNYLNFYHPNEFYDPIRGTYKEWASYKKAVFNFPGTPKIDIQDLSIFEAKDYIVATFKQNYRSNTINDTGKKMLYLKKDEFYNFKIVSEIWSKNGIGELSEELQGSEMSFEPSLRFFKTRIPSQIMSIRTPYEDTSTPE